MNKYKEELRRLAELHDGHLTADLVVEEAVNPASPLHDYFEWDDAKAAHSRRLDCARDLIGVCRVEIIYTTHVVNTIAYVRDQMQSPKEQGYVSTVTLTTKRDEALKSIVAEVVQVRARVERTRDLARGLDMVEEAEQRLRAALD